MKTILRLLIVTKWLQMPRITPVHFRFSRFYIQHAECLYMTALRIQEFLHGPFFWESIITLHHIARMFDYDFTDPELAIILYRRSWDSRRSLATFVIGFSALASFIVVTKSR